MTHLISTKRLSQHRVPVKRQGHTQPREPVISLDQPGRLRVAHVLAILGVSHSTFYAGKQVGRYPGPDGRDGAIPFWKTSTIRDYLDGKWCPPSR